MNFSVLVLHGPNLSLLAGDEIDPSLHRRSSALGVELICVQSNGEEGLLDALHEHGDAVDGVIVNPGAIASIAFGLAEGLQQLGLPVIEVLLKPLPSERGPSALLGIAKQHVHGLGVEGYVKALELLVPEGKQRNPLVETVDHEDQEEEVTKTSVPRGKSIGRKRAEPAAAVTPTRGKTIGRGAPTEQKSKAPPVPTKMLTKVQVRDRIKARLKGSETAESLAQWARETWTSLQRGAPCEAKETVENVLLTLMAGAKVSDQMLVAQMAKLDP